MTIFSDLSLSRRLERAEGRVNADFVDARAIAFPEAAAEWIEVGGAFAMFDGVESPLTQTFGLGLQGPVEADELDRIEQFFARHHAPVFHEVSPLADASVLSLFTARGYHPFEFTSVMWREIAAARPAAAGPGMGFASAAGPGMGFVSAAGPGMGFASAAGPGFSRGMMGRTVTDDDHDLWARTAAAGWRHLPELAPFLQELATVNRYRKNHVAFLVEIDGAAVAAGGLAINDGIALLAGASTIPSARRRGAQRALLEARLRYAAARGCDIAMMGASPGSDSQRNAERQGFRIAYTRLKWRRIAGA